MAVNVIVASINEPITKRVTAINRNLPFHLIFKLSDLKLCLININIVIRVKIKAKTINTVGKSAAFDPNFHSLVPTNDGSIANSVIRTISYGIQITEVIATIFLVDCGNNNIEIPYIQHIKAIASNP